MDLITSQQNPKNKVTHLVVDAGPLIKGCSLHELGENFYTNGKVLSEIRDGATRQRVANLPYEFKQRIVPKEVIDIVSNFAKKTGDFASLSMADLLVIALTYLLEKEFVGTDHLNTTPKPAQVNTVESTTSEKLPGFYIEGEQDEEDSWATKDKLDSFSGIGETEMGDNIQVACLTTDYAMQNVLIQMGLKVVSVGGMRIKQLRTYVLRCHACFKLCSKMEEKFCPCCGNKTLKKVGVTTDEDGTQHIHINFKKPINIRGMQHTITPFKGGKHSNNEIIVKDQRVPQNKLSKKALSKMNYLNQDCGASSENPFSTRDVHSRSFYISAKSKK